MRDNNSYTTFSKALYPSDRDPSNKKSYPSEMKAASELLDHCLYILSQDFSVEENNKWLMQNKINSYMLRNDKAAEVINLMNYLYPKVILNEKDLIYSQEKDEELVMLGYLFAHYDKGIDKAYGMVSQTNKSRIINMKNSKTNKKINIPGKSRKIIQFCHLLRHFSLWDYEFDFFYQTFKDRGLDNISLYLKVRNEIIQSPVNRYKKQLMSGVLAQIEQWSKLAQKIFKNRQQTTVVEQFTQVVKIHYIQLKKNQNQLINGAQFFKICQLMSQRMEIQNSLTFEKQRKTPNPIRQNQLSVGEVFKQSLLNDLTSQDRQLIRILSYKDKNVARLLEEKHNKMVHMIGEEVDTLRKNIENEKQNYLHVIQEKKTLLVLIQKIKKRALNYVIENSVSNEEELFEIFDFFNQKYNPHALDVRKTRKAVEQKRLIQIIEAEQRLP